MLSRFLPCLCLLPALLVSLPAHAANPDAIVLSRISGEPLSDVTYRILQEAYRRLGIRLSSVALPVERSLRYSNSGGTDGEVMRIAGLEQDYPNLVRVPVPLLEVRMQAFTTGANYPVHGWQSLQNYRLCVRSGIRIVLQHTEGMQREITHSEQQLFSMLRAGRCDMAILSQDSWLLIDRLHQGPLHALEPPLSSEPLYHYLNKRRAALLPGLTAVLRDMQRDHSMQRILQQFDAEVAAARARQALP
ncbi:ABC transporter substrate-binding protein [Vogesella sp. LIG4]|uniref:substrate-binding periplasmic protein n=1 Tax=Vogesella sp. LIG4 TaxID=1192162 RepID=UPI00081F8788|nr:ABC transporter substrate-binding protein [Vogesella sp. LIG4]SCK13347.1 polar amino acid transport system substrate-binding protein [Vogesella sp. LIG4]